MTKTDEKILSYLSLTTEDQLLRYGNDTYFCGGSKFLSSEYIESRIRNVKKWVEKHGGRFSVKSEKIERKTVTVISGNRRYKEDRDGIIVQIIFPCYNHNTKKDMKGLMAVLY